MKSFEEWLGYQQINPSGLSPTDLEKLQRVHQENLKTKKEEGFKNRFCDLATQYYLAGRLAARAGLIPVHGNLFHHAVEMYLKAALVGTLRVEQLRRRPYSHALTALWDRFKAKEVDPALARFDPTIQALQAYESIRYPDKIVDEGMIATVVWQSHHATTARGPMPPKYEFIIADIDNLVIEVLRRMQVNPKFLVPASGAWEALEYQNPQATKWL